MLTPLTITEFQKTEHFDNLENIKTVANVIQGFGSKIHLCQPHQFLIPDTDSQNSLGWHFLFYQEK